jgi:hypothetical protein
MYSSQVREQSMSLLASGLTLSEVARRTSVSRSTLREWASNPDRAHVSSEIFCRTCGRPPDDDGAYAALLGYYLGDGCLSAAKRCFVLRISCDSQYAAIIDDVVDLVDRVRPGSNVHRVRGPGVVVVSSGWKHWPCLFPQHGPGRKHERRIALEPWQQEIVDAHPGEFLRGLFHSDGCRVNNWATRVVGGRRKRYDYPRWMFSNRSDDIIDLCTATLDLVGIAWRRPRINIIAVSRAADVAALDALIGPKR